MKNYTPRFSSRYCDSRKIYESGTSGRYYGGAGGFSFIASIARNGAVRDGSGNVRGYVTRSGGFRRAR